MLGRFSLVSGAAAALVCASPLAAQDAPVFEGPVFDTMVGEGMPGDEGLAEFLAAFRPEPLTAEQEARLPQAEAVIEKMVPPGTLGEMMGSMFDQIMGPIMKLEGRTTQADVAKLLGADADELELDEAQVAEAMALLDPARGERNAKAAELLPAMMDRMMTILEPFMKKAMAEAYVVYFDANQLSEIDTFFSTETGAAFARKSFAMSTDPRILGASLEAMPQIMGSVMEIGLEMEAAMAGIPDARTYAELDAGQRARLAELTGLTQEEIEEGMGTAGLIESGTWQDTDDRDDGSADDGAWGDGEAEPGYAADAVES